MENRQQTAVEWLAEQMLWNEFHNPYLEQAKAMEKEQIVMAYHNGYSDAIQSEPKQYEPEQYYTETYGK
jgi:hypothetical protein